VHGSFSGAAARELPQQPTVDGAKGQLTTFCTLAGARDVLQHPGQFGGREIGVDHQARVLANQIGMTGFAQGLTTCLTTAVLPDDGVAQGLAALPVPQHRGLTLVGDANGMHL